MRSIWLLTLLAESFCYAQNPGDMKPATSTVLDAQYPKVQHIFYESQGADREWQTWRRDLKDFAPRLFQSLLLSFQPLAEGASVGYPIPDFRAVR
jgi:hypothetical protein